MTMPCRWNRSPLTALVNVVLEVIAYGGLNTPLVVFGGLTVTGEVAVIVRVVCDVESALIEPSASVHRAAALPAAACVGPGVTTPSPRITAPAIPNALRYLMFAPNGRDLRHSSRWAGHLESCVACSISAVR